MTFSWEDLKAEMARQKLEKLGRKTGDDLIEELEKEWNVEMEELSEKMSHFIKSANFMDNKELGFRDKVEVWHERQEDLDEALARIVEQAESFKKRLLLPVRSNLSRNTAKVVQKLGFFSDPAMQQYRCLLWTQRCLFKLDYLSMPARIALFASRYTRRGR